MKLFVLKLLAFLAGSFACYSLQRHALVSPVLSAATTGFLGSFLHFPTYYEKKGLHGAIYAGSFAAMCSPELIEHSGHLVILSIISTGLYLLLKSHLNGFGGKLGTIAFVSSVLFFLGKTAW